MMITIYLLTNTTTGKQYVGQTKNINRRLNEHFTNNFGNIKHIQVVKKAILKYGKENFKMDILLTCEKEVANTNNAKNIC